MPYQIHYNYGSFIFHKFENYLFAHAICILDHEKNPGHETFRNIVHGSRFLSEAALNSLFGSILYNHYLPEEIVEIVDHLKQVQSIINYYSTAFADDMDAGIIFDLSMAVINFKKIESFPYANDDMYEIFRLFADLGVEGDYHSKACRDPTRLMDVWNLCRNWSYLRRSHNMYFGERQCLNIGAYYLPPVLKEEIDGDMQSCYVAENFKDWSTETPPMLFAWSTFAVTNYVLPPDLNIKPETSDDLMRKLSL